MLALALLAMTGIGNGSWSSKALRAHLPRGVELASADWLRSLLNSATTKQVPRIAGTLIAQAMGQTDLERRAATVSEAQRQLRAHRARVPVVTATAAAPAPAAGGSDADFQYDLLNLLRRTVVQLTRIADVAEGIPELDSQ